MAVTIKKISELCGVSRGTVDRVLHGRGNVNPEKAAQIRLVAKQLGYKPNLAGKALAARKKSFVIGVLLTSVGIPFFDEVLRGIDQAGKELGDYGVQLLIRAIKGYHPQTQLKAMEEMRANINALVFNPINDPAVIVKINELAAAGTAVFTVNTDVENSGRLCYIGSDYTAGGRAACGMLGLLTGGQARIGILTGSVRVLGHNQRITGFTEVMKEHYPNFSIADIEETNDDDIIGFEAAQKMLRSHPDISALFIVAAGEYGACRAVLSDGRPMAILTFDLTPKIEELIRQGIIQATICQRPFEQGYQAVQIAFSYLLSGAVPEKDYILENEIKFLQNL